MDKNKQMNNRRHVMNIGKNYKRVHLLNWDKPPYVETGGVLLTGMYNVDIYM